MPKIEKKSTLHILIRYGEQLAPQEGTIKAHQDVIKQKGYVWLGKFGKKVGDNMFQIVKKQIDSREPAYLFLVKYVGGHYIVHAGFLTDVSFKPSEPEFVPSYYSKKLHLASSWFKINKIVRLDAEVLKNLPGKSSSFPIIESLRSSMAGLLYVKLPKELNIMNFQFKGDH